MAERIEPTVAPSDGLDAAQKEATATADSIVSASELARRIMLLEADPAFVALTEAERRINPFRILGKESRERWHSAFWSWLLSPSESHGLGDFALKRLLMLCCNEEGRLVATEREISRGDGSEKPIAFMESGATVDLTVSDVLNMEFGQVLVAPGQLTGRSEVSVKVKGEGQSRTRKSRTKDARFDVLLVADAWITRGDRKNFERRNFILGILVEMKVFAAYEPEQLERYSEWLHKLPAADQLVASVGSTPFIEAHNSLLRSSVAQRWIGVGAFIAPTNPEESGHRQAPSRLAYPWQSVSFAQLLVNVLEPVLVHLAKDSGTYHLIQSYFDVLVHPDTLTLPEPPMHHKQLVDDLFSRHAETFRLIAAVAQHQRDKDPVKAAVADSLDASQENEVARRRESLTPAALIEAGVLEIGTRFYHNPTQKRELKNRKPFEEQLVAELVNDTRDAFMLVDGPADLLSKRKFKHSMSASGLLSEVYGQYGTKFGASGNANWFVASGDRKDNSLDALYGELIVSRTESDD